MALKEQQLIDKIHAVLPIDQLVWFPAAAASAGAACRPAACAACPICFYMQFWDPGNRLTCDRPIVMSNQRINGKLNTVGRGAGPTERRL